MKLNIISNYKLMLPVYTFQVLLILVINYLNSIQESLIGSHVMCSIQYVLLCLKILGITDIRRQTHTASEDLIQSYLMYYLLSSRLPVNLLIAISFLDYNFLLSNMLVSEAL